MTNKLTHRIFNFINNFSKDKKFNCNMCHKTLNEDDIMIVGSSNCIIFLCDECLNKLNITK